MRSDTGTTLPIAGWWITNGRLSAEAFRLLCALALRLTVVGERDSPTQVDLGATLNMSVRSVRRNFHHFLLMSQFFSARFARRKFR